AARVEVVEVDEPLDRAAVAALTAEQEGAALVAPLAAPTQLRQASPPEGGRAAQSVLRRREVPNSRSKRDGHGRSSGTGLGRRPGTRSSRGAGCASRRVPRSRAGRTAGRGTARPSSPG